MSYLDKNGLIYFWSKIKVLINNKADSNHTHNYNNLSNKPAIPTKTSELTNDSGFKTTDNNTTYRLSKSGNDIVLTGSDNSVTKVIDSNTTYSEATTSTKGLMSSIDKQRLNELYEFLSTKDLDGGVP